MRDDGEACRATGRQSGAALDIERATPPDNRDALAHAARKFDRVIAGILRHEHQCRSRLGNPLPPLRAPGARPNPQPMVSATLAQKGARAPGR